MEQTRTSADLRTLIHLPLALLTVLLALGPARTVFAATEKTDFEFVFRLDNQTKAKLPKAQSPYKYRTQAASYEEAFKKAAQSCYTHFKGDQRLSEEVGLSLIDTCANPRGS